MGKAAGESFEVRQVGPKVGSDPHAVLVGMRQSQLKGPKETGGARDSGSHEAEFAKQPLPFLGTNASFVVEVLEDGEDACLPPVSELQRAMVSVQDPS